MADSGSSAAPAGGSLAPATIQDSCGSTPKKPRLQHAEEAFAATFAPTFESPQEVFLDVAIWKTIVPMQQGQCRWE